MCGLLDHFQEGIMGNLLTTSSIKLYPLYMSYTLLGQGGNNSIPEITFLKETLQNISRADYNYKVISSNAAWYI